MDPYLKYKTLENVEEHKKLYRKNLGISIGAFICIIVILVVASFSLFHHPIKMDFFSRFSTSIAMIAVLLALNDFRSNVQVRTDYPWKLSKLAKYLKSGAVDILIPIIIILTIVFDSIIDFGTTVDTILALLSLVIVFLGYALSYWGKGAGVEKVIHDVEKKQQN